MEKSRFVIVADADFFLGVVLRSLWKAFPGLLASCGYSLRGPSWNWQWGFGTFLEILLQGAQVGA
jgi:hypothetical protein